MSIRIGIMGYGNLGKGIECAIKQNDDMELAAVFTRRDPATLSILTEGVPVYSADEAVSHKDEIDVLILCGGSATDLPKQTKEYAKYFNVIDSFDTHANIPEHFANVDAAA
ncbi:MAG: diaminopimelate dehydrogenase, partial [Ruminococcus sp.]|nr:diaminopimelate dehydrogenase [Ruminococcus sp.]